MSRRSPSEGSISKRKDGRWQGALQINGKRVTVYAKTRAKVFEKLREIVEATKRDQKPRGRSEPTLERYLTMWLDQAEARVRPSTLADYRVIIYRHIVPRIGHLGLPSFSALQLMQYQSALLTTLSKRRVRMIHDLLHKALGDAVRLGLVAANVAAMVDPPKRATRSERFGVLSRRRPLSRRCWPAKAAAIARCLFFCWRPVAESARRLAFAGRISIGRPPR